jgi:hypothetical protein
VDAADYSIWRNNLGKVAGAAAVTAGSGAAAGDYNGSGSVTTSGAVEAGSGSLLVLAAEETDESGSGVYLGAVMLPEDEAAVGVFDASAGTAAADDSLLLVLERGGAAAVDDALFDWLSDEESDTAEDVGEPALAAAWEAWGEL